MESENNQSPESMGWLNPQNDFGESGVLVKIFYSRAGRIHLCLQITS
jgi:hypothetical protein